MTKWIFPLQNLDEHTVHQYELDLIKARTEFTPSALETKIGRINFFLFSPDKSMSANIDWPIFEDWRSTFRSWCRECNISAGMAGLIAFDQWHKLKEARKASPYIAPVIMSSGIDLNVGDFLELKRVTIFCTKKAEEEIAVSVLQTLRQAPAPENNVSRLFH
jgi:hypothetical protein